MRILIDDFGIVALFGMPLSAGGWERWDCSKRLFFDWMFYFRLFGGTWSLQS